ncbi:unannotated protein [freshwater metagenome]|uniref:Unannotated protein n=1 Tax=freshwater metagenome TaxID=449393 RepID=A0A6J7JYZ4_9ZZZZ
MPFEARSTAIIEVDFKNLFSISASKSLVTKSFASSYGGSMKTASYWIEILVLRNLATDELNTWKLPDPTIFSNNSKLLSATFTALSSLSTACTSPAPLDSASALTAPEPAYRSKKYLLLIPPSSDSKEEKSASRARSEVGLVSPIGEIRFRPFAMPAIIRI